ncbi:MAG: FAD-binding protein [Calditrichaeota bacterium]|nr:FAD-binding protein [Calditrichota bacterium]
MDYDVIIIGSGAGGGSAAYNLAKSGKKVLIIEKGQRLKDPDIIQSENEMLINRAGYDNRDLQLNKKKSFYKFLYFFDFYKKILILCQRFSLFIQ